MEHFLKKTTSVSSSMNQSGEPSSDVKSPPLLSQNKVGATLTNTTNPVGQRPSSIYTSSFRPQPAASISNNVQAASIDRIASQKNFSVNQG